MSTDFGSALPNPSSDLFRGPYGGGMAENRHDAPTTTAEAAPRRILRAFGGEAGDDVAQHEDVRDGSLRRAGSTPFGQKVKIT